MSVARGLRERIYLRRARIHAGSDRFGAIGAGTVVHPPSTIIGHHRIHLGRDVVVNSGSFISLAEEAAGRKYSPELVIGDRVVLGSGIVIACAGRIEVGDDVLTADRVFIGDTYHEYRDVTAPVSHQGLSDPEPVKVGAGAFLGIGCSILPGVTIGEGAYVGAGAIVARSVPPHSVAVGNPARVIRRWDGERWSGEGDGALP